jgi:hypothetical protein
MACFRDVEPFILSAQPQTVKARHTRPPPESLNGFIEGGVLSFQTRYISFGTLCCRYLCYGFISRTEPASSKCWSVMSASRRRAVA